MHVYIWICTLNMHLTVTVVFVPLSNYIYALRHLMSWRFCKDTKEVLNKQIVYLHDYFVQHMCLISEIACNCWTWLFYNTCFFWSQRLLALHKPLIRSPQQESPTARATSEVPKESEVESQEAPKARVDMTCRVIWKFRASILLAFNNDGPVVVQSLCREYLL